MIETAMILLYCSLDGCAIEETFHTLHDAQRFAHHWVGEHPDLGRAYAVSGDGIGKIHAWGIGLSELFPEPTKGEGAI